MIDYKRYRFCIMFAISALPASCFQLKDRSGVRDDGEIDAAIMTTDSFDASSASDLFDVPESQPDATLTDSPVDTSVVADVPTTLAPRQISPISLGNVSLLRPNLRWQLPAGADGAQVELCTDRACSGIIENIFVTGIAGRPSMALRPRSVVFWRLRAMRQGMVVSAPGPTWLFHVPQMDNSGGIDASSNPHLDLNGDGYDDLVVGHPSAWPGGRVRAGTASVYHGGDQGVSVVVTRVLNGVVAGDYFGASVAGAGDLNGDGFGDLIVGAYQASPGGRANAGSAFVFHGSMDGVAMTPAQVLEGVAAGDWLGNSCAGAGDLNGDGYGDLVVGAPFADPGGRMNAGTASVFHGSPTGVSTVAAQIFEGRSVGDEFGCSVAGAGRLNSDSFGDIVVGARQADPSGRMNAGTASVYHGSAMGILRAPAIVLEGGAEGDSFGSSVASAGDVNADGFGDLVVGAYFADPGMPARLNAGTASVFHGTAGGIQRLATSVLSGVVAGDRFGFTAASAGDLNGDGFGDLVVGANFASPRGFASGGVALVFYGSAGGIALIAARTLEGSEANENFSIGLAGAGDLNRDGFDDLVVGSPYALPGGKVSVFHGSLMGVPINAARVIAAPDDSGQFGISVAILDNARPARWRAFTSGMPL